MAKLAKWMAAAVLALGATAADDNADAKSVLNVEIARQNNASLFWGPYKPNLYFGVRPRTPQALWTGLMWGKVENYDDISKGMWLGIHVTEFKADEVLLQDLDIRVSRPTTFTAMDGTSTTHAPAACRPFTTRGTTST